MKKFFITIFFAVLGLSAFAQIDKPKVIVMPSDKFCQDNNYVKAVASTGSLSGSKKVNDYEAVVNDDNFSTAATAINAAFSNYSNGVFNLTDLSEALSKLSEDNAFDEQGDDQIAATADDQLMAVVKPDIKLELTIKCTSQLGPRRKSWNIRLRALDAYTAKQIGGVINYNTPEPTAETMASLIPAALNTQMNSFCGRMLKHFADQKERGREVAVRVISRGDAGVDLVDEEVEGEPLYNYILKKLQSIAFNGIAQVDGGTSPSRVSYLLRVPFKGGSITQVIQKIKKMPDFPLDVKVKQRGMGQCDLIVKGKKF